MRGVCRIKVLVVIREKKWSQVFVYNWIAEFGSYQTYKKEKEYQIYFR